MRVLFCEVKVQEDFLLREENAEMRNTEQPCDVFDSCTYAGFRRGEVLRGERGRIMCLSSCHNGLQIFVLSDFQVLFGNTVALSPAFQNVIQTTTYIVNCMKVRAEKARMFGGICKENGAAHVNLMFYFESGRPCGEKLLLEMILRCAHRSNAVHEATV